MPAIRTISCALLAITLASCSGTTNQPRSDLNYPGTLQSATRLPVQAVWQQRVTAAWQAPGEERQERGFDAALQRSGDSLTVIGLSPMGSVGFSIQQSPTGIDVVNNMPDQMVIPPRFILLDVQRAFFPWLDNPITTGMRMGHKDDEVISETFANGRLTKRTFARLDQPPKGLITIRYEWDNPEWALPTKATLDNAWFGYELTIVTHSETRLETRSEALLDDEDEPGAALR